MRRSLNEVTALCRRAARGAGFSYGEAEDAAFAVRWLSQRNLPGAAALRGCLECRDAGGCDGACGFRAGAAYLDTGQTNARFERLKAPMLALPFVAMLADRAGLGLGCAVDASEMTGIETLAAIPDGVLVRVGPWQQGRIPPALARARAEISDDDLEVLMDFAARTYAPATEASRLSGAGAGLSDND